MTVPGEKNVSSPEKIHSVDVTFAKEHAQLPRRGRVADPTREPGVREWARLEPHTASRAPDLRGAQIDIEWDVAYRGVAWRPKARARKFWRSAAFSSSFVFAIMPLKRLTRTRRRPRAANSRNLAEPVSDAMDRVDEARGAAELVPESLDVGVHGPSVAERVRPQTSRSRTLRSTTRPRCSTRATRELNSCTVRYTSSPFTSTRCAPRSTRISPTAVTSHSWPAASGVEPSDMPRTCAVSPSRAWIFSPSSRRTRSASLLVANTVNTGIGTESGPTSEIAVTSSRTATILLMVESTFPRMFFD